CVARPDLLDRRQDWGSGRLNATSMVLQGLTADDALLLSTELVEVSAHEAGTCERIIDRAEGNPLHLEQLFASLTADGSRWESAPLPPTVYALLAARIDALSGAERLTLDLAAIIGREFAATGVQQLAAAEDPASAEQPGATLRELTRRRLIEPLRSRPGSPAGSMRYRFSSGLIQEVAYKGMAKRLRSKRHERFAGCLATDGAPDAEVGGHLERAYRYRAELGEADPSTQLLRTSAAGRLGQAGAAALAHADLCWAEDLLGRAASLLQPDEGSWAPVAQQLAEVRLAVGQRADGLALMQLVLAGTERSGDDRVAAHARLGLATHDPASGLGSAADVARAAMATFSAAGDQLGLARAGIRIAQEMQVQGRHGQAVATLEQALGHAVLAGAEPERAMALGAVGVSLWRGPTSAAAAIERCRQLLDEHAGTGSTVQVTLNCPLSVLYALADQPAEATRCLELAGAAARRLGYAEAEVFMPLFSATVAILTDRAELAESQLRQALRACDRLGQVGLLSAVSWDLARVLVERAGWAEARSLVAPCRLAIAPSEAADQLGVRARIEALGGDADQAIALARDAVAEAARTDSPISSGVAELDRAQVLRTLGRPTEAGDAARAARDWFVSKQHAAGIRIVDRLIAELGEGD
ncbi:MAG: adenylate/guanylate cyclase domain-containing protein, partial [Jatrophihabitantaceae bacterium]